MRPGQPLEQGVAELLRQAGGEVTQNTAEYGPEIDVFATFKLGPFSFRLAVECKEFSGNVGVDRVIAFVNRLQFLRTNGIVDVGAMITTAGFSTEARNAAKSQLLPLHLLHLEDLFHTVPWANDISINQSGIASVAGLVGVLHAVQLDDRHARFWTHVGAITRARKFLPETQLGYILDNIAECTELAHGLGEHEETIATILTGIVALDRGDARSAADNFRVAHERAIRSGASALCAEAAWWHARALALCGQSAHAVALLAQAITEHGDDPALRGWSAKARYWYSSILLSERKKGRASVSADILREQFQRVQTEFDQLGFVNYREGARAALGKLRLCLGQPLQALPLLQLAHDQTPFPQDKHKLLEPLAEARNGVPLARTWTNEVEVSDLGIWRFSRFPRDQVLPMLMRGQAAWARSIRGLLAQPQLLDYCSHVDGMGSEREQTKYQSLLGGGSGLKMNNSKRRRLQMCRRLLFSSVLVNDTGINGGVALVALSDQAARSITTEVDGRFTTGGDNALEYDYTTRSRLRIGPDLRRKVRDAARALTAALLETVSNSGVFPLSIDFFVNVANDSFEVLEAHYPCRGWEVLFTPFREHLNGASFPLETFARALATHVAEAGAKNVALVHNPVLRDDSLRRRSSFYGFEFDRMAEVISAFLADAGVDVKVFRDSEGLDGRWLASDIVIIDDVDPTADNIQLQGGEVYPCSSLVLFLADRTSLKIMCERLGLPTPRWVVLRPDSYLDFEWLRKAMGDLVVVKERRHLPSWEGRKVRGEFVDLRSELDRARLRRYVVSRESIVETVTTWSQDDLGHCGELRLHVCGRRRVSG